MSVCLGLGRGYLDMYIRVIHHLLRYKYVNILAILDDSLGGYEVFKVYKEIYDT